MKETNRGKQMHSSPSRDFCAMNSVWEIRPPDRMPPQLQLVQQERRFYFVGRTKREILFTVLADSLDEARQKSTI